MKETNRLNFSFQSTENTTRKSSIGEFISQENAKFNRKKESDLQKLLLE